MKFRGFRNNPTHVLLGERMVRKSRSLRFQTEREREKERKREREEERKNERQRWKERPPRTQREAESE